MSRRCEKLCVAATLLLCCALCRAAAPDFGAERVSDDVRYAALQAVDAADALGRPFAIVDKREARLYMFDAGGHLAGASAVLLGLARGDTDIADIAQRSPDSLGIAERNTPAGRFDSRPGHNLRGEPIVWVDYAAALAIHRLRAAPPHERRAARLASATPDDNRISLGCIVVPEAFFDGVVAPLLGAHRGVVYVLPETRPVHTLFDALQAAL